MVVDREKFPTRVSVLPSGDAEVQGEADAHQQGGVADATDLAGMFRQVAIEVQVVAKTALPEADDEDAV